LNFRPSAIISEGYKYNINIKGMKIEIKWHGPDASAASKFPGSNSGNMLKLEINYLVKMVDSIDVQVIIPTFLLLIRRYKAILVK